jgi:hypothetical protein
MFPDGERSAVPIPRPVGFKRGDHPCYGTGYEAPVSISPRAPSASLESDGPLLKARTPLPVKCRCGTHVPPGEEIVSLSTVPRSLASIFRGGVFCSPKCLRAFCLETFEIVDALDTPAATAMVTDLHELYRAISSTLARIPES